MKLFTILALTAALGGGHGDKPDKPELRIKPAATIRGLHVTIGDLCEISPLDATTQAIAQVRFGPAPTNGYSRAVSRTDVVQALAAAGVQLKTIELTGQNEVVVQTLAVDVPQQDMLDAATNALQAHLAVEGGDVEFEPPLRVRRVKAPPGRVSLDVRARVRDGVTHATSALVDVEVIVDGEVFKRIPLTYKLQRFHMVLTTIGTVRADTPLGPENVRLQREPMAQHTGLFLDRMDQVTGMNARRNLRTNQRLTLGDIMPPALIHKGDVVTVVMTRGRVKVTARAIANHDAPIEGRIQLTNPNSRTQLTGVVYGPGLVVVTQ